jgi:hypothetical protein
MFAMYPPDQSISPGLQRRVQGLGGEGRPGQRGRLELVDRPVLLVAYERVQLLGVPLQHGTGPTPSGSLITSFEGSKPEKTCSGTIGTEQMSASWAKLVRSKAIRTVYGSSASAAFTFRAAVLVAALSRIISKVKITSSASSCSPSVNDHVVPQLDGELRAVLVPRDLPGQPRLRVLRVHGGAQHERLVDQAVAAGQCLTRVRVEVPDEGRRVVRVDPQRRLTVGVLLWDRTQPARRHPRPHRPSPAARSRRDGA